MKCDFCSSSLVYKDVLMFTNLPLGKPVKKIVADEKCKNVWQKACKEEAKLTGTIIHNVISS